MIFVAFQWLLRKLVFFSFKFFCCWCRCLCSCLSKLPVHDETTNTNRLSSVNLCRTFTVEVDRPLRAERDRVVQDADAVLLTDREHAEEPGIELLKMEVT